MLDSLLAVGGLVLLRDSVECEGRSLLKALIKKSALRGEQIHVLGCEVSEEEFREGFGPDINSRVVYHDLFKDPLNWSKSGEAVPEGPLGTLRTLCRRTDPGPVTIALDSVSWLLFHLPCITLCKTLHALSQPSVSSGADSLVDQTWWFSILPDLSVDLREKLPLHSELHPDPHTTQVDPTTDLTFNLHLSKKEREARDSLTLPFQFSSEKQQALLRRGPGQTTSHIFYEPDAFDDVDQEDPDDDLDI
ncbi:elongator complex protein 5 isoform X3 [Cricetulus griseus]|uniref:Elongator complex protein 5 n=1 Tax=Cricetulus griseus TaxID=10029 RepID=A0A9J7JPQ1_CRIGR|nr:elongator complex protein 5 isoform X3 [Cricetulus griseus]XP_027282768.1 elongator complex protein 5 isoform X3 [Cricetulus griseus]ERE69365.1 putative dermal papilla-derived protein 6 like protein [Cricetulus griseus]